MRDSKQMEDILRWQRNILRQMLMRTHNTNQYKNTKKRTRGNMKQTIKWHENGLNNRKQYYEQRVQAHKREKEELDKTYNEIRIIEYQIESAKKEGKDRFDGEKYKRIKK